MNCCNEFETEKVCFVPVDGVTPPVTLLLHIKKGVDAAGAPKTVSYLSTAADLNTALDPAVYLGGGAFTPGICPLPQPDIEWTPLCEALADGSSQRFIRRAVTTFDAFAAPMTVIADFELDKVTPYVVVDESAVGECPCPPLANIGLVTDLASWQ